MKALVISGQRSMGVYDVAMPQAGPGEVLTKVKYCGICGTDLSIYTGETGLVRDGSIKYPVRPGHEWSGVVEAVGSGVKDLKPGDKVVGDTVVSCGVCKACLCGSYMQCRNLRCVGTVNAWDGGFAEYTLFPARHLYKIPDGVRLDEAAMIEPAALGMNALHRSGFEPGRTVLVTGTGAVGLLAAALARTAGASKVIIAGRKDAKLTIGKAMGADVAINIAKEDLVGTVMRETDGNGADLVIECSGAPALLRSSLDAVAVSGTIAVLGFYERELDGFNIDKAVFNCVSMIGIAGSPGMYAPVINLLAAGKVDFIPVITDRYRFGDIMTAFRDMQEKSDTRIKILVEL